jgi:prepilin-type N-terminal cleavage/methylation domain-containing protein
VPGNLDLLSEDVFEFFGPVCGVFFSAAGISHEMATEENVMMGKKGFTLTEVLIVVVFIGILAALIIPRFSGQDERGYVAEAVAHLSALRQAEASYYLEQSTPAYTATLASLDVDLTQTKWTYACSTAGDCTATRTSTAPAAYRTKTIILQIDGTWTGDHLYKPT